MRSHAKAALGAIVAGSLLTSSGARAWTRQEDLVAGALVGATVGVLAGSAFAAPQPRPVYVYRARPAWDGYPPPRVVIEHGHDGDDPFDDCDD